MPSRIPIAEGVKDDESSMAGRIRLVKLATIMTPAAKERLTSMLQSGSFFANIATSEPKDVVNATNIPVKRAINSKFPPEMSRRISANMPIMLFINLKALYG